jgi:NAD(P)H-flavin reductase/ferredoxin
MHRISLADSDVGFNHVEGFTILAAGRAAGIDLPYECASGGCGTCKARLIEGEVYSLWPEATGLSERDQRKGDRILTCQSVPTTPCVLAIPSVGDDAVALTVSSATVATLCDLNHCTRLVELAPAADLPYLAGQFVMVTFPDGTRRAYSMSRPYRAGEPLEFVVRSLPGGAATGFIFDKLQTGDTVMVEGPYGRAYLQSALDRPIVGVAGGSGLGPVLAVAEQALREAPDRSVSLYFGSRLTKDLFFIDRLRELQSHAAVHIVVQDDPDRDHVAGLVGDVVNQHFDDLTTSDVYMCGPKGMIDACLASLVRTGKASADRVFFDRFQ